MKRSRIAGLVMLLAVIPGTLILWKKVPYNGWHVITALELVILFLLAFERRKPQIREIAAMTAYGGFTLILRAIMPFSGFSPVFALIMLAGITFGEEIGFVIGAVCSGFLAGPNIITGWQMIAFGAAGALAGAATRRGWLPLKGWILGAFCFFCTVLFIGPLLDTGVIIAAKEHGFENALSVYLSGLPMNIGQGICGFLTMLFFGESILKRLDRVTLSSGIQDTVEQVD